MGLNNSINSSLAPFCPRVRNSLIRTLSGGIAGVAEISVPVAVNVGVLVGVTVAVAVALDVSVKVGVRVGVAVAVTVGEGL